MYCKLLRNFLNLLTFLLIFGVFSVFVPTKVFAQLTPVSPDISVADTWEGYTINNLEVATLDTTLASTEPSEPNIATVSNTVWFKFVPTENGYYFGDTCNADYPRDTYMFLYQAGDPNTLDNLTLLDENNDMPEGSCPVATASRIIHYLQAGKTYYYQLGNDPGVMAFTLYNESPLVVAGEPWITTSDTDTADIHVIANFYSAQLISTEYSLAFGDWLPCTADDGTFDAQNVNELVTCHITGLIPAQVNPLTFRAVATNNIYTFPDRYLTLDLSGPPAPATLSLDNKSLFTTSAGDFLFTGTVTSASSILDVKWRQYVEGQALDAGWETCAGTDTFTCTIPTSDTDGQYYFEFKTEVDHLLSSYVAHAYGVGMLDTAKHVDAWFSLDNVVDGAPHAGDSRAFGVGSVVGTPALVAGKFAEGAVAFDESTYFELPDPDSQLAYSGTDRNFSIKARFKPYSAGAGVYRTIIYKDWVAEDSDSVFWNLTVNPDGKAQTSLRLGRNQITDDGNSAVVTSNTVNVDQWNEVTASWDVANKIACISLNGENTNCYAWLYPYPIYPSVSSVYVGGSPAENYGYRNFIGELDDVYVTRVGDATPPVVTITPLATPERVATSTPTLVAHFEDTNGGVASAEYFVDSATTGDNLNTWVPIPTPDDGSWGGTIETATIVLPALEDGGSQLLVRSRDLTGNQNVANLYVTSKFFQANYRFNVEALDTTPPRIFTNAVMPNPSIDRKPAIRGYVKDYLQQNTGDASSNIAQILYSLDGGSFTSVSALDGAYNAQSEDFYFQIPADLSLGEHTIRLRAIDASGNTTATYPVNETYGDVSFTFTVTTPVGTPASSSIEKNITFDTHDLEDSIFSDAIWGNGIVRLRQKINFTEATDYSPIDPNVYGYASGGSQLGVYASTDGNLWVSGTDGSILYYNVTTKIPTLYATTLFKGYGGRIRKLLEFSEGGKRYLMLSFTNSGSTLIYDINNTPEDVSDDPVAVDFASKSAYPDSYQQFVPMMLDTRDANLAVYGYVDRTTTQEPIIRLEMHGDPMNVEGYTYTAWGHSQGVGDDLNGDYIANDFGMTALYFDQPAHMFVTFNYDSGMYVCDDNNTPTDTADDVCTTPYSPGGTKVSAAMFSITKDANGWYWIGGDNGLVRINLNNTADRTDDTLVWVMRRADIANETISDVKWVPGVYPVGDEIWVKTRYGTIRAIEYNTTYDDTTDDTSYFYKIKNFDYGSGSEAFCMPDKNTIWVGVPGVGLDKITIDRTFEDSNTIQIYPTPPANLLEVDHVLLQDVVGSVSIGSSHTLTELLTYEVSNDAGVTWRPASLGDTIDFLNSDYKLKIRITLHKGSTPIMQGIKLSYVAQPAGTIAGDLQSPVSSDESKSTSCKLATPAGTPLIYKVLPIDSAKLKIYFNPINKPMDAYQIQYGTESGKYTRSETTIKYSGGSYILKNLSPATSYFIRIRAINDCKKGEWSSEVKGITPAVGVTISTPPDDSAPPASTPPELVGIKPSDSVGAVVKTIESNVAKVAQNVQTSSTYLAGAIKTILPIGAVAGLMTLVLADVIGLLAGKELKVLTLVATGFFRRRRLPWGVVYDSRTKRPLDPVIVTLTSEAGKVYTTVTDMFGRYSFIVNPGVYKIHAVKTDYAFPSKLVDSQLAELVYDYVLASETVVLSGKEIVNLNIPMDVVKENWNEVEKKRMGTAKAPNKTLVLLRKLGFVCGVIWTTYATVTSPTILNGSILAVFTAYLIFLEYKEKYGTCGHLKTKAGTALSGYVVELVRSKFPTIGRRQTVTDSWGRYSFLVDKSEYKLIVYKLVNATKVQVYESENMQMKKKIDIITKDIIL